MVIPKNPGPKQHIGFGSGPDPCEGVGSDPCHREPKDAQGLLGREQNRPYSHEVPMKGISTSPGS